MVVRVHRPAKPLGGKGREDLVRVHVGGGTGARLEDVDREVLVPAAVRHLVGRLLHRLGDVLVEDPELGVDLRGGHGLDPGQCLDVGALQALAGDGEVLHGTLRLGPPLGVGGDPYLTHGVVLDPVLLGHRGTSCSDSKAPQKGVPAPDSGSPEYRRVGGTRVIH